MSGIFLRFFFVYVYKKVHQCPDFLPVAIIMQIIYRRCRTFANNPVSLHRLIQFLHRNVQSFSVIRAKPDALNLHFTDVLMPVVTFSIANCAHKFCCVDINNAYFTFDHSYTICTIAGLMTWLNWDFT